MPDDNLPPIPDSAGASFENIPEFEKNAKAFEEFVLYLVENAEDYRSEASVVILRSTISDRLNCQTQIAGLKLRLTEENLTDEYKSLVADHPTITVEYIRETIIEQIDKLNGRMEKAESEYAEGIARIELTFVGKNQATAESWLKKDFNKNAQDFQGRLILIKEEPLGSGVYQITCTFEFGSPESYAHLQEQ